MILSFIQWAWATYVRYEPSIAAILLIFTIALAVWNGNEARVDSFREFKACVRTDLPDIEVRGCGSRVLTCDGVMIADLACEG